MRGDSNMSDSGFYKSQKMYQHRHRLWVDKIYNEARADRDLNKKSGNLIQRFVTWLKSKLLNK